MYKWQFAVSYHILKECNLLHEELSDKVLICCIGALGYLGHLALEPLMLTA